MSRATTNVLAFPKRRPNPDVVKVCEELLAAARSGEITGLMHMAALGDSQDCGVVGTYVDDPHLAQYAASKALFLLTDAAVKARMGL